MNIKNIVIYFNIFLVFFTPFHVFAYEKYKLLETIPFIGEKGSSDITLSKYLLGLYHLTLASIIIAALVMIIIGGYYYITSAGNQARSTRAKEIIWNAITGLVIAFFVGILFITINPDILKFSPEFNSKIIGANLTTSDLISNSIGEVQPAGTSVTPTGGGAVTPSGNAMADKAMSEYIYWNKGAKKECDPSMKSRLTDYWASAGVKYQNCKKVPWSAAFISYVTGLKAVGHWQYINDAYHNKNGWKFNDVHKYTPKVGDLVCGSRDSSTFNPDTEYKSHCDIVYSVKGNVVTTIGGNVGNTVRLKHFKLRDGHLTNSNLITVLSHP